MSWSVLTSSSVTTAPSSQVTRTVQSHLMSEVPLGAFLSGGVDSSAVVAAMSGVTGGGVEAVSVGVQGDGLDERVHAREVAGQLDVRLHEETAEADLLELLPQLAWHLEAPFADTSAAPTCQTSTRRPKGSPASVRAGKPTRSAM